MRRVDDVAQARLARPQHVLREVAGAHDLGLLWGLPEEIVEAVAFHHEPAPAAAGRFSPALAVYVANELAAGTGPSDAARAALAEAGCEDRFDVWASLVGACHGESPS